MKFLTALCLMFVLAAVSFAGAPPVEPSITPAILPTPPGNNPPPSNPGGNPKITPVNTPEPSSLAIVSLSLAAAGVYRFARRRVI
jgi:hypothetical protein